MPRDFHLDDRLALDQGLLHLDSEQLAFLQKTIGIQDEDALREHIFSVQAEAYDVFPYSSIRSFTFLGLGISRNPAWPEILRILHTRPNALLLDVGCCFGTDTRKAVSDGWPARSVIATDIIAEFWDLGRKLFRADSGDEVVEDIRYIQGDILDSSYLATAPPAPTHECSAQTDVDTRKITTLTELQHGVSAIHLSAIFHLFPESAQVYLARALAGLLAPHRGACIFGWSVASTSSQAELVCVQSGVSHPRLWLHSPGSWKDLWEDVFGETQVEVRAEVRDFENDVGVLLENGDRPRMLVWSVTRI
ncbi:unnamed protein product [Peniophora sp. CBMAI 1063]|nr:unnamed protein product [Peniophora sp. CBMAI 1063]